MMHRRRFPFPDLSDYKTERKLRGERRTKKKTMKSTLIILCAMSAMCAAGADNKPSGKKTSLSAAELRTLATSAPTAKNAGMLYSAAMATTNDVERKQSYLKAAAACLIASDKNDIYEKHIKDKLQNAAEFESELKDDCRQCSGSGTKEHRCYVCNGNGRCVSCKGSGQTTRWSYGNRFEKRQESKPCSKCNESGRCNKCRGKGATKGKCMTCAGTGNAFSKKVAARVFRDSCNAVADNMVAVAREKAESERRERERIAAEARAKAEAEERERERIAAEARAKAEAEKRERERIEAEERKRKYIAEANGDVDILCNIGFKYYLGNGVLQDYYRAIEYLDCASQIGCARADCILAHMYLYGEGCKKDDDTMTKSFVHAKKGLVCKDKLYEVAACALGVLYCTGFKDTFGNYQMNTCQAYKYFSACESDSDALFFKGLMEYHGIGTDKNPAKAAETFYAVTKVKSSALNKGRAQMCLGYLYLHGEGIAKNIALAWKMLREGVELAYPKLVKAAKEPPTVADLRRFKEAFGNNSSIHSPFSWKMYNLYKWQCKFSGNGAHVNILEMAFSSLFAADYWGTLGIEYDLLPEGY